jgi:hypothetical protein
VQIEDFHRARLRATDANARARSTGALFFGKAEARGASPRKAYETGCLPVDCMQRITVPRDRVGSEVKYNLLWY